MNQFFYPYFYHCFFSNSGYERLPKDGTDDKRHGRREIGIQYLDNFYSIFFEVWIQKWKICKMYIVQFLEKRWSTWKDTFMFDLEEQGV